MKPKKVAKCKSNEHCKTEWGFVCNFGSCYCKTGTFLKAGYCSIYSSLTKFLIRLIFVYHLKLVKRKLMNEPCSNNNECTLYSFCDFGEVAEKSKDELGKCSCKSNRFWNGASCGITKYL